MSEDNIPWDLDPARTHKGMGPLDLSGSPTPVSSDRATANYRLGSRLGLTGQVYEAQNARFAGRLVVKLFPFATGLHPTALAAFTQDATRTAQLRHPHIVQVLEAGTLPDGTPFVAMERLVGRTLEERLDGRGALPVSELLPVVRGIASALSAAHAVGVVHRELRPDNVFITELAGYELGFVKLLDFGASHLCAAARAAGRIVGPRLTRTLAPEQRQGSQGTQPSHVTQVFMDRADERTDQFALAALTYRLLTGVEPFAGQESGPGFERLRESQRGPSDFFVRCAPAVDAVLCKALSRRPESRFDSVDLFFRATEEALAGTSLIKTPAPILLTTPVAPAPDAQQSGPGSQLAHQDSQVRDSTRGGDSNLGHPAAFVRDPVRGSDSDLGHPSAPVRDRAVGRDRASARDQQVRDRQDGAARQAVPLRPHPGRRAAGVQPDSLTQKFFVEGEQQEASGWKTSPLLEEDLPDTRAQAFDSFDQVPKRRFSLLAAAVVAVTGLGIASWATGWPSIGAWRATHDGPPLQSPRAAETPGSNPPGVGRVETTGKALSSPPAAALVPGAAPSAAPSASPSASRIPGGATVPAAPQSGAQTAAVAGGPVKPSPVVSRAAKPWVGARSALPPARGREVAGRPQRRPEPLRGYAWSPNQGGLAPAHLAPLPSESPPPPLGDPSSLPPTWSSPPASSASP